MHLRKKYMLRLKAKTNTRIVSNKTSIYTVKGCRLLLRKGLCFEVVVGGRGVGAESEKGKNYTKGKKRSLSTPRGFHRRRRLNRERNLESFDSDQSGLISASTIERSSITIFKSVVLYEISITSITWFFTSERRSEKLVFLSIRATSFFLTKTP